MISFKNQYDAVTKQLYQIIADINNGKTSIRVPSDTTYRQRIPGTEFHGYNELFIQLSGSNRFIFPDSQLEMKPGDVMLLPAQLSHGEKALGTERFRHFVAMFQPQSLQLHFGIETRKGELTPTMVRAYSYSNFKLLDSTITEYIKRYNSPLTSSIPYLQSLQTSIISFLLDTLEYNTPIQGKGSVKVKHTKQLVSAMFADSKLSVSRLAHIIGCNPDYLSNIFRKETNEPLANYILRIRLEAAKSYLQTTSMTISEIAWACGFENPSYFSFQFRKRFNITPTQTRIAES